MSEPRCKHCGKPRGYHQAVTLKCPIGPRTRVGYIGFCREQAYEAKAVRPREKA